MNNKPPFRRRNYFIKKGFQIDFSVRFIILIVIEALLAVVLFIYMSKGTVTTGYMGSDLKVAKTFDFFLPGLFLSNMIVLGITAIAGVVILIFMSHKIAGPLYRFEKSLSDMSSGDLTYRFKLREGDQLISLADSINGLNANMDRKMGEVKSRTNEISNLLAKIESLVSSDAKPGAEIACLLNEVSKKMLELEEAVNYFKTSEKRETQKT